MNRPSRRASFSLAAALCAAVPLALVLAPAVPAVAADWPAWRGPAGDGTATAERPPLTWSEKSGLCWKIDLPGAGLSTPVVSGDRIFLTAAVPTDRPADAEKVAAAEADLPEWRRQGGIAPSNVVRFVALALDRKTGETLWQRTLREAPPHEGLHADATWASASAVTDGEIVIAHFGSHGTYALTVAGEPLWERDLGDMRTRLSFGEGSSPALHGDRVVINWDHEGESFLAVLDRKNGETLWKKERDEPTSWSTPVVVPGPGGDAQIVISATGATRGYDLDDGTPLWEIGGMTVNAIPTPIHRDGRVFVASGFRGAMLQAIDLAADAEGRRTANLAWSHERDTPYVPSPLLYRDRLYFVKGNKGILSALAAGDGSTVFGPVRLDPIDGIYASPVAAADRIYVVGRDGTTLVLGDGPELEVLAENTLDDRFDASPAFAGDDLLLRGREHLYCVSGGAGEAAPAGAAAAAEGAP